VSNQSGCVRIAGCAFIVIWLGVALLFIWVFLGGALPALIEDGRVQPLAFLRELPLVPLLVFLLMAGVGVAVGGWILWRLSAGLVLARPVMELSKEFYDVGDRVQVSYRQQFRRAAEVERAELLLLFRETVTYTRGSDTYTDTHDVVAGRHQITAPRSFQERQWLDAQVTLPIPRDGMHTFMAPDNKVQWYLRVEVDVKRWADYRHDSEIQVRPVLAGG
jgi:hypothetical protein